MKRTLTIVILALLMPSALAAGTFRLQTKSNLFIPEKTGCITVNALFEKELRNNFSLGEYVGLGFSARHFTDMSANALVYGPALDTGLQLTHRTGETAVCAQLGIKAVYAQYPTILWADTGISFSFGNKTAIGLGFLLWKDEASFRMSMEVDIL